ncbi:hypothetical protein EDF70_1011313 [Neorhizobium sp. JUb45]|nr:hypothetical protein EDF70_1011313 [Neorhizobium sp. JUb45]
MFLTMTILAGLISTMFVATVMSSIAELRREREDIEDFARRHRAF